MSTRPQRGPRFHLSYPEQLEARAMLAGHGHGGGGGGGGGGAALARILGGAAAFQQAATRAAAQFTSSQFAAAESTVRDQAVAELGSHCGGAETNTFTTTLTDDTTGESATVTARTKTYDGETETSLKVSVTGAAADSSLDVTVNGEVVGAVQTDANGAGTVTLKDLTVEVADGTPVGVGTLTGNLALSTTSTPGEDHGQRTVLRSTLSDEETGAAATVKYKAFTNDDTTTSKLVVRVTGAAASSSLDVAIDGTVVGTVETDENGAGKAIINDVTATAGSSVTVGTLTGTLETVAAHYGRWHWHR